MKKMGDFVTWPSPRETLQEMYGEAEALHLIGTARRARESQQIYVISQRPDLSWWIASTRTSSR